MRCVVVQDGTTPTRQKNWRINTGLPGNIVVSHLASNRIRDTPSLMTESHLSRSSPRSALCPSLSLSLRLSVSPHGDGARPSENLRRSAHARQIIPPNYSSDRNCKKGKRRNRFHRRRPVRTRETRGRRRNRTKKKWKSCNLHGLPLPPSPLRTNTEADDNQDKVSLSLSLSLSSRDHVKGYAASTASTFRHTPPSRFFGSLRGIGI